MPVAGILAGPACGANGWRGRITEGWDYTRAELEQGLLMVRSRKRRVVVTVLALAVCAAGVGVGAACYANRLPKRFAPVVEGRLYRSGEVSPSQLERLQRDYGIGRVVCLLNSEARVTAAEREAAQRLGVVWENVSLPGDGASTPAERDRIRQLLLDPNAPPTLVHCAAGVNRTGLAVGMYRLHAQHWPLEKVMAELLASDFENEPKHEELRAALVAEAASTQPAADRVPEASDAVGDAD